MRKSWSPEYPFAWQNRTSKCRDLRRTKPQRASQARGSGGVGVWPPPEKCLAMSTWGMGMVAVDTNVENVSGHQDVIKIDEE